MTDIGRGRKPPPSSHFHPNHRYHPAGRLSIPSVRFQYFRIAVRTKTAAANLSGCDAISSQFSTGSLNKIDLNPSLQLELSRHFGTHFETASTNSGTDRNHQILRLAVEVQTHSVDGFRRDLGHHPAPSGVNRGNCSISRIGDQDRETIGGSNRQADAGAIGNQRIALALRPRRLHHQNAVGVNLFGSCQFTGGRPRWAEAGPKTVPQPRQTVERFRAKNLVAATLEQSSL